MQKYILLVFSILTMVKSSYCQETTTTFHAAPFPYIHRDDSILLYRSDDALLYKHIIRPKQTLFSIAKYYGINLEQIYAFNPQLIGANIATGAILQIPIPPGAIVPLPLDADSSGYARCYYRVHPGETLYGIARRTLNSSVAYLTEVNPGLRSDNLHPGQLLHIGWMNIMGISPFKRSEERAINAAKSREQRSLDSGFVSKDLVFTQDKNLAFWNKSSDQSGLFVIHKYITPGTIIQLYNPNMDISVKAKVVGSILPGTYPPDIDLVVSSQVANDLGVIDPRFYVKVSYYK